QPGETDALMQRRSHLILTIRLLFEPLVNLRVGQATEAPRRITAPARLVQRLLADVGRPYPVIPTLDRAVAEQLFEDDRQRVGFLAAGTTHAPQLQRTIEPLAHPRPQVTRNAIERGPVTHEAGFPDRQPFHQRRPLHGTADAFGDVLVVGLILPDTQCSHARPEPGLQIHLALRADAHPGSQFEQRLPLTKLLSVHLWQLLQ